MSSRIGTEGKDVWREAREASSFSLERPLMMIRLGSWAAIAWAVAWPIPLGATPVISTDLPLIESENTFATSVALVEALNSGCEVIVRGC